jgi:hypothetical protein
VRKLCCKRGDRLRRPICASTACSYDGGRYAQAELASQIQSQQQRQRGYKLYSLHAPNAWAGVLFGMQFLEAD